MSHLRSIVWGMKNTFAANNSRTLPGLTATDIATAISFTCPETLSALRSVVRHPRSLARPLASWRPPSHDLPAVASVGAGPLRIALTRYRVGPRAKARVRGFGEKREPVYLINARLTHPGGGAVDPTAAEGWIRALAGQPAAGAVHEFHTSQAATFMWLVDRAGQPVASPASLFEGFAAAA